MKRPENIELNEFEYHLPDSFIARFPLNKRDNSRLLIYKDQAITEKKFSTLPELFDASYNLIFNETRVIHARLKFKKKTGADIEIFCLEPVNPSDYFLSFSSQSVVEWKCLIGNNKKWKEGYLEKVISYEGKSYFFRAEKSGIIEGCQIVSFSWDPEDLCFGEILEIAGETPIPPYLKREAAPSDSETYQTIYSKHEGSVAAPTAGFHFTSSVLDGLKKKNTGISFLTLHVGAGTFVPVKDSNAVLHRMHREKIIVSRVLLESLRLNKRRTVAVGTTSCRSLESLYWLGVKSLSCDKAETQLHLSQWEAYDLPQDISVKNSIEGILRFLDNRKLENLEASTEIMISPGYDFKMTDVLITNFHQPSSTLLMLVSAFIGDSARKMVYSYALENKFRFLSYGDSSVLFP